MALWLLAGTAQLHAATFNAKDYGAVGDDKTDNTAAFARCMDAVVAAGGGKMFLPEGVYRGRIVIPPVSKPIPSWMTVEIEGAGEPPVVWGTIGNFPLRNQGTILKCLETSGPAVISASPSPNSLYGGFSAVQIVIRNLEVRTCDNPAIGGIDLLRALQCRIENVVVNTGVYNVQASKPTHGTAGVVTPANLNAALTLLRNVLVTGYHTGILVHEHTDGDNINLGSNIHGLEFAKADHSSRFGRVCSQRCTHAVTVTGRHGFTIRQLAIEKTGPRQTDSNNVWQATAHDLNDPQNLGVGDINQWVVRGNVGAVEDFTRNGGANIRTRRLGEATIPAPPESTGPNGGFEAPAVGSGGYLEIPVGGMAGGWRHAEGSASAWIIDQDYAAPQLPAAIHADAFGTQTAPVFTLVDEVGMVAMLGDAELAVVLGANPTSAEKRVAELLAERVKDRSGISLAASPGKARVRVVIGTVESNEKIKTFAATQKGIAELGPDGFHIASDLQKGEVHVVGQSNSGVVAGVGRLMRGMRYHPGRLELPELSISASPQMPNRGMYLWARRYYFNEPDKVDRYIEEFALWGGNAICFWFEMGMFDRFDDASPQDPGAGYGNHKNSLPPTEWIKRYQHFYETARRMGMKTGLLMVANDAYRTSPPEMRIQPVIGSPDCYLCPSKPGAVEKMLGWQEEVFKALAPIDIFNIFPADPGGCSCADCAPWPTGGFWKVAQRLGDRIHAISPKTEIWMDTWHLNHPTFGGKDWINLVERLGAGSKERPEWFAGFEVGMAPKHPYAAMSPEERKLYNKAQQPLMVFPDISMWGLHPGMLVKKDYWKALQAELNSYDTRLLKGGWPYAERWNTDIACVMFLAWYWDSKKSVEKVMDEYAASYFGPAAPVARRLLDLLDDGNQAPDRKEQIRTTLAELETTAPEWVKRDWRWREIVVSCGRFK